MHSTNYVKGHLYLVCPLENDVWVEMIYDFTDYDKHIVYHCFITDESIYVYFPHMDDLKYQPKELEN